METVAKKKISFLKRGILLGGAALVLFIILVLLTYPYERTVERALSRVNRESAVSVASEQTNFSFPNKITFYSLKIAPKEKPYHLLETTFTRLSAQVALGPLLTKTMRVRFTGDLDSGDPSEGEYRVSGTVCLRRSEKQGADGRAESRVVELENVRLNGSYVNLTVDGNVTIGGNVLDPDVELKFAVEKLKRTDSTNYAIENLLRFVEGAVPSESTPPLAFAVSGPFSQLTVRQERGESGTKG